MTQRSGRIWPEPIFDRVTEQDSEFGSFVSQDQLYCIEGDLHDTQMAHSLMRATPLNPLYRNAWYGGGVTCHERGYDELFQQHDDCWGHFTRWVRTGSPTGRVQHGTAVGGQWQAVLDKYDVDHNYPVGTSREWVACSICTANSSVVKGSWGQSYDCETHPDNVVANIRSTNSRSSFISDNEYVCFEGSQDYLESVLQRIRAGPMASLFVQTTEVIHQDCEARGYDVARDIIDECWPNSAKHMRSATEDDDMVDWILDYREAINSVDTGEQSNGLWSNTDWVSCQTCEAGGAVRDRGLWTTFHGGDSTPYTNAYCRSTHWPSSA